MFRISIACKDGETARGQLQSMPDDVGRDPHPNTIHIGASLLQDLTGFLMVYFQTCVLQYMQDPIEQLFELVIREHSETHT
jgi:hypothetical protein